MPSPDSLESAPLFSESPEAETSEITLLRRKFGEKVHPISTDTFLKASKEYYSRPSWLAREIAQNFVDHNPGEKRGTLEGVSITSEDSEDGTTRFRIGGDWTFRSNTGLTTMHSEKPQEGQSAGGNGIGLKQTALVFLRDFGTSKFEVEGERWKIGYRIIPSQESGLTNNWFVAEELAGGLKGHNAYTIETQNPALVDALRELPHIAVGPENEFLKELDFENEHGGIKWLPPENDNIPGVGRLFINGQVMDVADGPDSRGWKGMRGATLRLNNVNYGRNMDRPPLAPWVMGLHAGELIRSMKPEQLIDQISRAETIWAAKGNEKWESLEIVEGMVKRLATELRFSRDPNAHTAAEGLKRYFEEKKYLARAGAIGEKFEKRLEEEGYVLCPGFFVALGMQSAMEKMDATSLAAEQKPDPSMARYGRERLAEQSGVEVGYQAMGKLTSKEFVKVIEERLRPFLAGASVKDGELRMEFSKNVASSLITRIAVSGGSAEQQLVSAVRDIAAHGLSAGFLKQAAFLYKEGIATFGVDGRGENASLFVRTKIGASGIETSRLEARFDEALAPAFQTLGHALESVPGRERDSDFTSAVSEKARFEGTPDRRMNTRWAAAASLTAFLALAGWLGLGREKAEGKSEEMKAASADTMSEKQHGMRTPSPESKEYEMWKAGRRRQLSESIHYPGGRSLTDIVAAYNRANVPGGETRKGGGEESLEMSDAVENFEIVREPSLEQLERLAILRDAFYALTGNQVQNDLFIFNGKGAKGINIGREGIGIHSEVLRGGFQEAMNTFIHEVGHNNPYAGGHDALFVATTAALSGQAMETLMTTLDKFDKGEKLNVLERKLIESRRDWGE